MDNNQARSFGWLKSIVIFLVGLFIGLVVLGWWLWPVEWVNASPEQLTDAWHQEYLRMAIDSYTVNQDAGLAQMRYEALGPYAESTLNSVAQNPGTVPPAEIDSYANVVQPGGLAAISGATAPVTAPARNIALIVILVALFLLLLVVAAIVLIFSRNRRDRRLASVGPEQSSGVVLEETTPVAEETVGVDQAAMTIEEPVAEETSTSGLGAMAAVVAAAAGTAAFWDNESQTEEEAPVIAAAAVDEEQPALEEESSIAAVEASADADHRAKQLDYIEGVGNVYSQKLEDAGITTAEDLLEKGSTPKGRKEIAESSGISEKLILRWVNMVDLYRINGIGQEYADLLEAAGVDTVPELAHRVPENLLKRMVAVNEQKKLVRHLPVLSQVTSWVEQAKQLPRVIHY